MRGIRVGTLPNFPRERSLQRDTESLRVYIYIKKNPTTNIKECQEYLRTYLEDVSVNR